MSEEGLAHLDQLIIQFQLLQTPIPPGVRQVVESIIGKRNDPATWSHLTNDDVYTLELALLTAQPVERLICQAWSLRERYRAIAGDCQYDKYLKTEPLFLNRKNGEDTPITPQQEIRLRAELEYLLNEIHWYHNFTTAREKLRSSFSKLVGLLTLIICGLAVLIFFSISMLEYPAIEKVKGSLPTMALVVFSGAIGGFVSMQRRIQSASCEGDPLVNILDLKYGRFSLLMAPLSGAIFAMVLYLFFLGELMSGKLFPTVSPIPGYEGGEGQPFSWSRLNMTAPTDVSDFGKLLIWCFIAGFAERFVPDTLDRLMAQNTKSEPKKSEVP